MIIIWKAKVSIDRLADTKKETTGLLAEGPSLDFLSKGLFFPKSPLLKKKRPENFRNATIYIRLAGKIVFYNPLSIIPKEKGYTFGPALLLISLLTWTWPKTPINPLLIRPVNASLVLLKYCLELSFSVKLPRVCPALFCQVFPLV